MKNTAANKRARERCAQESLRRILCLVVKEEVAKGKCLCHFCKETILPGQTRFAVYRGSLRIEVYCSSDHQQEMEYRKTRKSLNRLAE